MSMSMETFPPGQRDKSSFQVEGFEVLDEERVLDGLENERDVFGVRGAGEMRVERFLSPHVQILVQLEEELLRSFRVALRACMCVFSKGDKSKLNHV